MCPRSNSSTRGFGGNLLKNLPHPSSTAPVQPQPLHALACGAYCFASSAQLDVIIGSPAMALATRRTDVFRIFVQGGQIAGSLLNTGFQPDLKTPPVCKTFCFCGCIAPSCPKILPLHGKLADTPVHFTHHHFAAGQYTFNIVKYWRIDTSS